MNAHFAVLKSNWVISTLFIMSNIRRRLSAYLNVRKLHPVAMMADNQVQVFIHDGVNQYDITGFHALISLKPFAIAVHAAAAPLLQKENATLQIIEEERTLGTLRLRTSGMENTGDMRLFIFEAALTNYPVVYYKRAWNRLLLWLKNYTNKQSQNFVVPPKELLKLFVFSLKPRPVYLVSLQHEQGYDIFPVDIAGNLSETHCLFSVRSSSAAIQHILLTKRICAVTVPFDHRQAAYRLGRFHPGSVVPEADSIQTVLSEKWKIPVPAFAVQLQELLLEHSFIKGAHTQFLFRVINRYTLQDAPLLAHTPWFNPDFSKEKSRFDIT